MAALKTRTGPVPRYLYILSLERSGSTPLAWNLGALPGVVALGEVDRALVLLTRPRGLPGRPCTCGALPADCPVWGPVVGATERMRPLDLAGRYRLLDDLLEKAIGRDAVAADASKSLVSYRALASAAPGRVAAVHLVKDVRGYLDSTLARMATMEADRLWSEPIAARPVRARLMRAMPQSLVYLARWARRNRAMAEALEAGEAPWLRVGHDALCREPAPHLARMARLAGATDGARGRHILYGSFGYLDGAADKSLRRDDRWTRSPRRALLELAGLAVAGLNRRLAREASGHDGAVPEKGMR